MCFLGLDLNQILWYVKPAFKKITTKIRWIK